MPSDNQIIPNQTVTRSRNLARIGGTFRADQKNQRETTRRVRFLSVSAARTDGGSEWSVPEVSLWPSRRKGRSFSPMDCGIVA